MCENVMEAVSVQRINRICLRQFYELCTAIRILIYRIYIEPYITYCNDSYYFVYIV